MRQPQGLVKSRAGRDHVGRSLLLIVVPTLFAFPLVSMLLAPLRQPGLPLPRGLELIPDNPSLRSEQAGGSWKISPPGPA